MKLKPFHSYYGAKHRAVGRYPPPATDTIREDFCGSAAYATRYFQRRVFLADTNPYIVGSWDYLIHASRQEVESLRLLGPEDTVDDLGNVPQEAKWMVGFWLNTATSHPCRRLSAWGREKYGSESWSFWGPKIRRRIAYQVQFIRHWKVALASYKEAPDMEADWFVDPPYKGSPGGEYPHGNKGIDYEHLGKWCLERRGQLIVCENVGADWLPFQPFGSIKTTGGRNRKKVSKEVIFHRSLFGQQSLFV